MSDLAQNMELVNQVMSRLEDHKRLWAVAREIYAGIRQVNPLPAPTPFAGEKDQPDFCAPPGGHGRFDCAKDDFSCPSNYKCDQHFNYDNAKCNGSAHNFECTTTGGFSCKGPGGEKEFYQCDEFSCSPAAGGDYNCDVKFDFICSDQFTCKTDFDCNGGHWFGCTDDHDCKDNFECDAGGVRCDAAFPYGNDPTEPDGKPGDFECGVEGGDADSFNCSFSFQCTATDQFECEKSTTFYCGTTGQQGSFSCTAGREFDCESTFNCKSTFCKPRTPSTTPGTTPGTKAVEIGESVPIDAEITPIEMDCVEAAPVQPIDSIDVAKMK